MQMDRNRKLVGILVGDIQGFTAVMQEDETRGMAMLRRFQTLLKTETIRHGGEVIKNYGDGSICIFPSAVDTVACALAIQRELAGQGAVPLRIGLHLGDVIFKEGDIYGDALNVASRIESIGLPGAILLSKSLYEKVSNQPAFSFRHLDSFRFKNVNDPVDVYALSNAGIPVPSRNELSGGKVGGKASRSPWMLLLAAVVVLFVLGIFFWQTWQNQPLEAGTSIEATGRDPDRVDRSIAVLPFENLGEETASGFADGVHVDIMTRLAKFSGMEIISKRSVMHYRDSPKTLPEIANELGVKWVLTGEVQRVGDQVRLNARLVDARQDRQVWASSYQKAFSAENFFDIQAEVTQRIAEELKTQLLPSQKDQFRSLPTRDLEAYRLYVEGRALVKDRSEASMRRSVDYFHRVLDRDSAYALAWVGLAEAWTSLQAYGYGSRDSLLPLAWEAINRALEISPDLPEAFAVKGLVLSDRREGPEAIAALERASELRPNHAETQNKLSWVRPLVGQPRRALDNAQQAVKLDPLSHEAVSNLALTYMFNGQYERGLAEAERVLQIQPDFRTGTFLQALALYQLGRTEGSRQLLRDLRVPWTGKGPEALLALAWLDLGEEGKARELLKNFQQSGDSFEAGLILAALGETDAAFAAFEQIEDWGFWPTQAIRYFFDRSLQDLREDPRYADLIEQVDRSWGMRS